MIHRILSFLSVFFVSFSVFFGGISRADEVKIAPSFDCVDDISISQKVICGSTYLSSLDFELSTHISGLRQLLTRTQYLVEARTFVEKRVECGDDAECLKGIYEVRLWRVRSRVNDLSPVEGSWTNDDHASFSIMKIGSKYRLKANSPGPIDMYCTNGNSKLISRSAQFDKWDMKLNGFSYQWDSACVWNLEVSNKQLIVDIGPGCIREDGFFAGNFRRGEPSDLAFVCFDR